MNNNLRIKAEIKALEDSILKLKEQLNICETCKEEMRSEEYPDNYNECMDCMYGCGGGQEIHESYDDCQKEDEESEDE